MSTTPKKPAARRPCMPVPTPPAARDLSPTELELLAAYARMTPLARSLLVGIATRYAVRFEIKRAPALRLVVGGAA